MGRSHALRDPERSRDRNQTVCRDDAHALTALACALGAAVGCRPVDSAEQQLRAHDLRAARKALDAVASRGETISYSDLAKRLPRTYAPNGDAFAALLTDLSRKTWSENRTLLSAVVVHAGADRLPGEGFFTLAGEKGLVGTRSQVHDNALESVYAAWGDSKS